MTDFAVFVTIYKHAFSPDSDYWEVRDVNIVNVVLRGPDIRLTIIEQIFILVLDRLQAEYIRKE